MGTYALIKDGNGPAAAAAAAADDADAKTNAILPLSAAPHFVDLEASGKIGTAEASPEKEATAAAARPQGTRLLSLDVFRGLTVALMILVDDGGAFIPAINHSPWDGVNLADFVMPFFLFIVGVALALTYKRIPDKTIATKKAVFRALKLFFVGLVVQGGYFHGIHNSTFGVDILKIRWMGVLQRIAIAYLLTALCEIWLKSDDDNNVNSGYLLARRHRFQLLVGLILTSIYTVLLYGLYVADWEYQISVAGSTPKSFSVKCGVRGDTGPACNAVGFIDRRILSLQHMYRRPVYERTKECSINSPASGPLPSDAPPWCQAPFDPEGLLSSIMAIVTCLIGLQFGHVITHFKDHKDRIIQWMVPSFCLLEFAFALDFIGMRFNKALYTVSYTCITAGAAGILFIGIYLLVDVCGYRRPTMAIEWLGMHALSIYILIGCNILPVFIQGFYWKEPQNNVLKVIGIP